jgi:antitoxin (DNA-binding transcriptional repressor) of toxin-antitoxin stability system
LYFSRVNRIERFEAELVGTMIIINLKDLQRDLPSYLARMNEGETVLILQDNKPVAELKPVTPSSHQQRPFGLCAGEFMVPDDFDASLPDAILAEFEGGCGCYSILTFSSGTLAGIRSYPLAGRHCFVILPTRCS